MCGRTTEAFTNSAMKAAAIAAVVIVVEADLPGDGRDVIVIGIVDRR